MAHVDQEPRLTGRAVGMTLSPLPESQRQRKFQLFHGDLIEEDDFDEDDDFDEAGTDSDDPEAEGDANAAPETETAETETQDEN